VFKFTRFDVPTAVFFKIKDLLDSEDGGNKIFRNIVNLSTRCYVPEKLDSQSLNLCYFRYVKGSRDVYHVCTGTVLLTSNIRLSDRKPVHKHIIQPISDLPDASFCKYARNRQNVDKFSLSLSLLHLCI
jgi:hypothetical protein